MTGGKAAGGGVNLPEIPDSSARAYLSELAAEIVANGNPRGDLIEEARAAHARRQAFAQEMRDGATARARIARRVFAAQVWGRSQAVKAINSAMYEAACEVRS